MKNIPNIIYGTAWKEDKTEQLVCAAINAGFRGIDTANQRKHYYEAAVGSAIANVLKNGIKRNELFIQTKYTYTHGQDDIVPYDVNADYCTQVRQSFESSLEHLRIDYIDSYILHGPSTHFALANADWEVWRQMEAIQKDGRTLHLGISNVTIKQLKLLFEGVRTKPTFVQNRCFAQQGWDKDVRAFCKKNNIIYQGFSLLTANAFIIPRIHHIAERMRKTPAQIILKFTQQVGMLPLTGTTSDIHMKEDLALDFTLNEEDVFFIENIAVE